MTLDDASGRGRVCYEQRAWRDASNPIGRMLVADLTDDQGAEVRRVLDGMLRERSGGTGPAVLPNPVHIGIGVK